MIRNLLWPLAACVAFGWITPNDCWAAEPVKPAGPHPAIAQSVDASFMENLAAKELRRYIFLRTGNYLPRYQTPTTIPEGGIIVSRKDRPLVKALATDAKLAATLAALGPGEFLLKTVPLKGKPCLLIAGGDDAGVLYGAYRLAERLGVRFYMEGDVIPDAKIPFALPEMDEIHKPLFSIRGIQPFHDFPEGPDWWNADDYKAIVSQLPKMRMNFIGLHTYPEARPNAEPTVWIGQAADTADGKVKFSYPASYQNTLRGNWGNAAKKTSDFAFGAARLFERDDYAADVMAGACPEPRTPEATNQVFDRTGAMLDAAFRHARALGVKTCVGTETPLVVPRLVAERLKAQGKNPADPAVRQAIYEGMFQRIAAAYPVDYYWFWTPEGWMWSGASDAEVKATLDDLKAAIAAAEKTHAPFTLATCGWVLGPPQDRAMFDNVLPKNMPMTCISRQVGQAPVEPGFAKVSGRPKWSIPWLEDDPALTSPQLWVGRMRKDAVDSLEYGCTGLLGIHWRTRVLGPNVSALAQAAWTQAPWNKPSAKKPEPPKPAGAVGGQYAAFPNNAIAGTQDAPVYQTVRYNVSAYRLDVPDGAYTVTLKFCEPHYTAKEKRVFGVRLQGKRVIERLDIFDKVGQNKALDYTFEGVAVTGGRLNIDFDPIVEFPSIAAIVVTGKDFSKKINCGGPAYQDYAADYPPSDATEMENRFSPTGDFYADWAAGQFGAEASGEIAAIFTRIDGRLPRPSDWVDGPGGIKPDGRPWSEVAKAYAFVDELGALRPRVQGAGNLARFDYWLESFRYMRSMGQVNCTWAEYNAAMKKVADEKDPAAKKDLAAKSALPLRKKLVAEVAEVYRHLLATVSTNGELGTVANWDQHLLPGLLTRPGEELAAALGQPLPADAMPGSAYTGPTRVIVPTVRTMLSQGEKLKLKVIVLSEQAPREAFVSWGAMGSAAKTRVPLVHLGRGVYTAEMAPTDDCEYYVEVATDKDRARFPATAPAMNQTVVITP
ncbi:MAG: malectin domain-containing carbohydrate-binding protein [Pirellulales bacterium]